MKTTIRLGIIAVMAAGSLQAATYSLVTTGVWSSTAIWTVDGSTPATTPGAADAITIGPSFTLSVDGGNRTITNFDHSAAGSATVVGASGVSGSFLNITGTLSKTSSNSLTIRGSSNSTNPLGLVVNELIVSGGGNTFFGSSIANALSSFSATTTRVFGASNVRLNISKIATGTASFQNLIMDNGQLALFGGSTISGSQTLVVNNLSGTGGVIGTSNEAASNNTGAGVLLIDTTGTSTYGGVMTNAAGTPGAGTAASFALVKSGVGMQILTGSSSYTAGTTINGGVLQLGNGGTSGSITGNVSTTSSGATLAFNRSDAYAFSGTISGNGQISQIGTGTTTLNGNNTYTGKTTIAAGTLLLAAASNNIASSSEIQVGSAGTLDVSGVAGFTLASGQVLAGSGTVTGALVVGSGATLAPGNSPGTMTFSNDLTLAIGSTSNFEINGLTTGLYDLVQGGAGSQAVSFNGTLNLIFQTDFATNGTIKVFDFESYSGSFTTVNSSGLASGYTASFNALTGEVTVVPEPGACTLIGLGIGALLLRARGRRRAR